MSISREINAIFTIAARDVTKLLRDKTRIFASLIFPIIFIGALGKGFQSSLGDQLPFDYLMFTFTGVFAQVLFQSTASGVTFLIQDRENDFSQEIFVSPISRYTIVFGKIFGETLVSFVQAAAVIIVGFLMGVDMNLYQITALIFAGIISCLLGGAYGVLIMANMGNIRSAQSIFPFLIFPLIFISGVFNPIDKLPPVLFILSRLSPLTYAVDLTRNLFYVGHPDFPYVTLYHPLVDLVVIAVVFTLFLMIGTYLFVRNERNK